MARACENDRLPTRVTRFKLPARERNVNRLLKENVWSDCGVACLTGIIYQYQGILNIDELSEMKRLHLSSTHKNEVN